MKGDLVEVVAGTGNEETRFTYLTNLVPFEAYCSNSGGEPKSLIYFGIRHDDNSKHIFLHHNEKLELIEVFTFPVIGIGCPVERHGTLFHKDSYSLKLYFEGVLSGREKTFALERIQFHKVRIWAEEREELAKLVGLRPFGFG